MSLPPGVDLCQIPVAPDPSGAPPNFVNVDSNWILIPAVAIPFTAVSLVVVSIRVVTNAKMVGKLQIDDYLCLAAFLLLGGYWGLGASFRETARHNWNTPVCVYNETYAKRAYALNMIVGPALWASKATILTLYIRIFKVERWLRYTSYTALVILFLAYWALIPVASVFCTPRKGEKWDLTVLTRCQQHLSFEGPFQGSIAIASDIFILCLPLPILWKLNIPSRKKHNLALVFLVGIFAVIVSAISMYYRIKILSGIDVNWNSQPVLATAAAEGYITVICSCAPALYSFWTNYFVKSALYSSFRSGLFPSRATTSGGLSDVPDKSSHARSKSSNFQQLPSSRPSMEGTRTLLSEQAPAGRDEPGVALSNLPATGRSNRRRDGITKSTTISQSMISSPVV